MIFIFTFVCTFGDTHDWIGAGVLKDFIALTKKVTISNRAVEPFLSKSVKKVFEKFGVTLLVELKTYLLIDLHALIPKFIISKRAAQSF